MFETANLIEAGLWIVIGAAFWVYVLVRGPASRATAIIAGVVFVAFGLSDVVETQTGAWWRPWWLLLWKGACLGVMGWLLVRHLRASSTRPRS